LLKVVCHFYLIRRGHPQTNAVTHLLEARTPFLLHDLYGPLALQRGKSSGFALRLAAPLSTHSGFF